MLSLDISFIDTNWQFTSRNVGVIECKEGTTGDKVAKYLKPALESHGLLTRLYLYVKDGGSNLRTTATALSGGVASTARDGWACCEALEMLRPYEGDCMAHAVNGACNKSVTEAKQASFASFSVSDTLTRLRACGTYIKKSSVGMRTYIRACRENNKSARKISVPAKTRFTSVSCWLMGSHWLVTAHDVSMPHLNHVRCLTCVPCCRLHARHGR